MVAVSRDGRLAAGDPAGEGGIRVWDLEAGTVRVLPETKTKKDFWALVFSDDGSLYSGDTEGNVQRWNVHDGSSTVIGKGKFPIVASLAVTRDARFLLANFWSSSDPSETMASELTVFDLKNNTSRSITTHGNKVTGVALDPSEKLMVTGDAEGVTRVGPITGEEPHMLIGEGSSGGASVAVSPDGRWIASSAASGTISLWHMPEGEPFHTLPYDEFLDRLRALTNLRVVSDKTAPTGYRLDMAPFPGWGKVPAR
jgi:WD40 repeat protein